MGIEPPFILWPGPPMLLGVCLDPMVKQRPERVFHACRSTFGRWVIAGRDAS